MTSTRKPWHWQSSTWPEPSGSPTFGTYPISSYFLMPPLGLEPRS
jgi:hypothetical protein